jgi:hypothetical protein
MLATHPALVIAFTTIAGSTPGTRHTLVNAYRRGIRVVIVTPDGAIAAVEEAAARGAASRKPPRVRPVLGL